MWTNRSTTKEIDVNSEAVDDVVCLSDGGNPTTSTQLDGSDIATAMETRGTPKKVGAKKDENMNMKRWQYWHCECGPGTSTNQVVNEGDPKAAEVQPCKERSKEFDETDCHAMFEYFAKMKEANDDFFFSWRVDEADKLMDVIWVDARSRVAYMDFCNVPGGIITDQSAPMAKAIQQVLPDSRHKLCVWHILSKVSRKLLAVKKVGEVHKKMKDVVMSTTQRVESIHHFFKGFMNAKTSLREFIQKYTRAIEFRANAEKVATTNDDRRKTKIKSTLMVERFFQKIYTNAKIKEVQTECLALIYVLTGTEHKGILCCHCILAMEMTNIPTVLEKYVLNRRRKDVKRKHLDVKVAFHALDKSEDELRYGRLQYEYEKIFNLASTSNELCEHAIQNAQTFFEELEQFRLRTRSQSSQDDFIVSTQGSNDATQTCYHEQQNTWDGVENPPAGK
ncbi:Protein FAR-RED ELONGATED HYPOCOTYL 3 [Bienertia sinuspersici]